MKADKGVWSEILSRIVVVFVVKSLSCLPFTSSLQAHPLDYWKEVDPGITNSPGYSAVHFANGKWVIVGAAGTILVSTNATNWVARDSGTKANFSDIAYGGGEWIAVGGAMVAHSSDALTWTNYTYTNGVSLDRVAYGNGLWVATSTIVVPSKGTSCTIYSSVDGMNWRTEFAADSLRISRPKYGANQWIVPGGTTVPGNVINAVVILQSTNGTNWQYAATDRDGGFNGFTCVASDGTRWIAAGQQGLHSGFENSSIDGMHWQVSRSPSDYVTGLEWGGGFWVATCLWEGIYFSNDGNTWTHTKYPPSPDPPSPFGEPVHPFGPLSDLAYGKGSWVAVGSGGTTFASGGTIWFAGSVFFHSPDYSESGQVNWQLNGPTQAAYRIQVSTNLGDWTDLTSFISTNDTTRLSFPTTISSQRFFRAVSPK